VNEIEKLRYWKQTNPTKTITEAVVEEVTFGMVAAESFSFFDYVFSAPQHACEILADMQSDNTDRNQVGGLLYRGLRNYLIVLDFDRQGIHESKQIASEGKMPPFTASNLLKQLATLKEKSAFIRHFFKKLIALEYDIKNGILPAEYFRLAVKELVIKG
jgi:DNA polymerase III delta subunit